MVRAACLQAAVTLSAALIGLGAITPARATGQVRRVAELTADDLRRLDRARTVAILPAGILEEHGPYLPTYSDGYLNERLADTLARAIAARPGWTTLVFPPIPLGNSGANDIGARYSFPGTYTIRFETLRSVFMDLADELGAQGFRWVFIVHLHGAPNHSRALEQAGDYFHDVYGGQMVHLGGLMPVFSAIEGPKSSAARHEDGLPIHAGMDETSWVLFLRPDLVRQSYRSARPQADTVMEGLVRLAKAPNWPGYFGSPRLANRAHGAAIWQGVSTSAVRAALSILDGTDPRTIPRFSQTMEASPVDVELDAASSRAEASRAERQQRWVRERAAKKP
jgi:creatinine amidohydrolase/Fe(II)-dependent formamide hydrolase-like protein